MLKFTRDFLWFAPLSTGIDCLGFDFGFRWVHPTLATYPGTRYTYVSILIEITGVWRDRGRALDLIGFPRSSDVPRGVFTLLICDFLGFTPD